MNAPVEKAAVLTIATDGCCLGNPGPGGWAVVIGDGSGELAMHSGAVPHTTNNRMEMTAVIEALERLAPGQSAVILSDSDLTVRGCNEWRFGWRRRRWRKGDGSAVANRDLWERLDALLDDRAGTVRLQWVRGHNGHALNEEADRLANEAATRLQKELLAMSSRRAAARDGHPHVCSRLSYRCL